MPAASLSAERLLPKWWGFVSSDGVCLRRRARRAFSSSPCVSWSGVTTGSRRLEATSSRLKFFLCFFCKPQPVWQYYRSSLLFFFSEIRISHSHFFFPFEPSKRHFVTMDVVIMCISCFIWNSCLAPDVLWVTCISLSVPPFDCSHLCSPALVFEFSWLFLLGPGRLLVLRFQLGVFLCFFFTSCVSCFEFFIYFASTCREQF